MNIPDLVKNFRACLVFSIASIILPPSMGAQGDASPSVGYLAQVADVIVVGNAHMQSSSSGTRSVIIDVLRIIKASSSIPNNQINIELDPSRPGCNVLAGPSTVTSIWFLKSTLNGNLTFADSPKSQTCSPMRSEFEVSEAKPTGEWLYPSDASVEDKLAYELAASVSTRAGAGPLATVVSPDAIDGGTRLSEIDIYSELARSENENIRVIGFLGLIRQGDDGALSTLANNPQLIKGIKRPAIAKIGTSEIPLSYVGNDAVLTGYELELEMSLRSIVGPDDNAIASLGNSAAVQPNLDIRIAAARALRNVHNAQAVIALAPLLFDKDPRLRAEAIGGLSCFANGVPMLIPTKPGANLDLNQPGKYKSDETMQHFAMGATVSQQEDFYLTYWRSWWAANGPSIKA